MIVCCPKCHCPEFDIIDNCIVCSYCGYDERQPDESESPKSTQDILDEARGGNAYSLLEMNFGCIAIDSMTRPKDDFDDDDEFEELEP